MTYQDPIASLAPVPILVQLADREYEIPALPALNWLHVLLKDGFSALEIVPGLLSPEDQVSVEDQIALEQVTLEQLNEASFDVITIVSGRDWWFTVKFLTVCRVSWDVIGGMMARLRIDARTLSLAAWIDAAYHIAREIISSGQEGQQNLIRFTSELEAPPPGTAIEFDEQFEAEAFERAVRMAQH